MSSSSRPLQCSLCFTFRFICNTVFYLYFTLRCVCTLLCVFTLRFIFIFCYCALLCVLFLSLRFTTISFCIVIIFYFCVLFLRLYICLMLLHNCILLSVIFIYFISILIAITHYLYHYPIYCTTCT